MKIIIPILGILMLFCLITICVLVEELKNSQDELFELTIRRISKANTEIIKNLDTKLIKELDTKFYGEYRFLLACFQEQQEVFLKALYIQDKINRGKLKYNKDFAKLIRRVANMNRKK